MIPTKDENPEGLHLRYIVTKANGKQVDPEAEYFVLRLDLKGDDKDHIFACRKAIQVYADHINEAIPELAADLRKRYPSNPEIVFAK